MVSITYGHGFLNDCDDITGWTEVNSGLVNPSLAVSNHDYFVITGTCNDAGDENVSYIKDITNISSDTYTKYLLRYKTSVSSNGLGAVVYLNFTVGNQTILGSPTPAFSTAWTIVAGNITAGKTIDSIQLVADDYPNTVASGTYYVYFDFILFHKGTFTFPHSGTKVHIAFPPKTTIIDIPGMAGDVIQSLGSRLIEVTITGDMDVDSASWKRAGDNVEGEIFYDVWHNGCLTEPWQWLDWEKGQMKVTLNGEPYLEYAEGNQFYTIPFIERRDRGSAGSETYTERFGLNL